ncbi:MAG: outer membrane beta-barrel protein [Luteibacter sp.]
MKNVLFCVAAGAVATLAAPCSFAQETGWFVALGGAHTSMQRSSFLTPARQRLDPLSISDSDDRSDRAFDARFGYRWTLTDTLALGVEGGYADLGKGTATSDGSLVLGYTGYYAGFHADRAQKTKAILVGANARWHLSERWSLAVHAGVARYKTSFDYTSVYSVLGVAEPTAYGSYSHRNNDYYVGLSLGFDVLSNLTASVSYDQYRPESYSDEGEHKKYESDRVRATGINLEYRF